MTKTRTPYLCADISCSARPRSDCRVAGASAFTEDKNGFYINHRKFVPDASPMTSVRASAYQHWRIVNETAELHPFHMRQAHLLAYAENDAPLEHPAWLDAVSVPYHGFVEVILDCTDPVSKRMPVFHCHLLNHKDKGMMAKILLP
jgi:suppressor of ftsI